MVLAERNSENVRNGRRSRGPSPNAQTESSSEEDGGITYFHLIAIDTNILIIKYYNIYFMQRLFEVC